MLPFERGPVARQSRTEQKFQFLQAAVRAALPSLVPLLLPACFRLSFHSLFWKVHGNTDTITVDTGDKLGILKLIERKTTE